MTRGAVLATILMVAVGCDKAKGFGFGGKGAVNEPPASARLDLSKKPNILFEVFGERDDPRMIPLAVVDSGALKPIILSSNGWRQFDAIYARAGASYNVFQDGRRLGAAHVRQGMWEKPDEPLYSLPKCRVLVPLAAVTLDQSLRTGYTVEFLASNADLGSPPRGAPMAPTAVARAARQVAYAVGDAVNLSQATLDSLDFRGISVNTGATKEPTVISSFIDPNAAEAAANGGRTAHVFAIADQTGTGYQASYKNAVNGAAAGAEYRRYIDHLDLDGDGIDEIIIEGWKYGGDTFLIVLGWKDGAWKEIFRANPSWCLDRGDQ